MDHFTNDAYVWTHVARSKAQHYVRKSCTKTKTPSSKRKLYVNFAVIFLKDGRNCYIPSFFGCLVLRPGDSWPITHPSSDLTYKTSWNPLQMPLIPHSMLSLLSKVKIPKVLWEKSSSRPRNSREMSTYRVPKCGRHFVKSDDVTIYPDLVVARTWLGTAALCIVLKKIPKRLQCALQILTYMFAWPSMSGKSAQTISSTLCAIPWDADTCRIHLERNSSLR